MVPPLDHGSSGGGVETGGERPGRVAELFVKSPDVLVRRVEDARSRKKAREEEEEVRANMNPEVDDTLPWDRLDVKKLPRTPAEKKRLEDRLAGRKQGGQQAGDGDGQGGGDGTGSGGGGESLIPAGAVLEGGDIPTDSLELSNLVGKLVQDLQELEGLASEESNRRSAKVDAILELRQKLHLDVEEMRFKMEEEVARIQEEIKGKRAYFENARRLLAKAAETQGESKRLTMRMEELDAEAKGVYDGLEAKQRAEREAVDAARGKLQVQIDALDVEVKVSEEKIAELTVRGDKIGRRLIIVEHALGVARQRELEVEVKKELEIALEHEEHNKQFLWELGSALFEMRRKEEEMMRRDGEEKEGAARERALLRIYGAGTREELEKNRAEVGSTMQGMAADKTIVLQMTPAMDKQAFGHLAPTWLDGEDGAEHEAAVMLYNVEEGRQGVDGIKEVVRGDAGGQGFREEDRVEGLEDMVVVRDEIERTRSDAEVLEGERERWRVTLSRPRSRASWLMVKDGDASRMATAPSQSLGSSMMMMSGAACSTVDVSGVSMVKTRGIGGAGVGGDEAGSLVNLTMSRASARERARRRPEALGATGGSLLGESGSMSVVLGGDLTIGSYNRLGFESGKSSPAVTRATTAEVKGAAEQGDGGGQGQDSGMSGDPISPIVPFRRGDGCGEQGADGADGTRVESSDGGGGGASGQLVAEGGADGGGGSGVGEAAQVMRISTAKSGGGGLVRGSSSRTLQYVMAGSSAASSRLSTAAGGRTNADFRAVGGSGAHASSVSVRMEVGVVDGDSDDAYPEEGVDEIRYAAEARMRDRLVVIEESKRDGGLLFEAGRQQLAKAEELWTHAENDVLALVDICNGAKRAREHFDGVLEIRLVHTSGANDGKERATELEGLAKEALERWYGADAVMMLEEGTPIVPSTETNVKQRRVQKYTSHTGYPSELIGLVRSLFEEGKTDEQVMGHQKLTRNNIRMSAEHVGAIRKQWDQERRVKEVIRGFQSGVMPREEYEEKRREVERWHDTEGRWRYINGRWHYVKGKVEGGVVWNPQDFLLMAETDFHFRRREGVLKLAATPAHKDGFGRNKKRTEYVRIEDGQREAIMDSMEVSRDDIPVTYCGTLGPAGLRGTWSSATQSPWKATSGRFRGSDAPLAEYTPFEDVMKEIEIIPSGDHLKMAEHERSMWNSAAYSAETAKKTPWNASAMLKGRGYVRAEGEDPGHRNEIVDLIRGHLDPLIKYLNDYQDQDVQQGEGSGGREASEGCDQRGVGEGRPEEGYPKPAGSSGDVVAQNTGTPVKTGAAVGKGNSKSNGNSNSNSNSSAAGGVAKLAAPPSGGMIAGPKAGVMGGDGSGAVLALGGIGIDCELCYLVTQALNELVALEADPMSGGTWMLGKTRSSVALGSDAGGGAVGAGGIGMDWTLGTTGAKMHVVSEEEGEEDGAQDEDSSKSLRAASKEVWQFPSVVTWAVAPAGRGRTGEYAKTRVPPSMARAAAEEVWHLPSVVTWAVAPVRKGRIGDLGSDEDPGASTNVGVMSIADLEVAAFKVPANVGDGAPTADDDTDMSMLLSLEGKPPRFVKPKPPISLDLRQNRIGDPGAALLSLSLTDPAGCPENLTDLDLSCNLIGSAGATSLGDMLALNAVLEGLNIGDNQLDALGVKAVALGLAANQTLARLDLSSNLLTGAQVAPLCAVLAWNPSLVRQIQGGASPAVNMTLRELVLDSNALGADGAKRVAGIIGCSSSIKVVKMADNIIGDQGATFVAEALSLNKGVLEELWLSNNSIGDAGALALANVLQDRVGHQRMHRAVEKLGLSSRHIRDISLHVLDLRMNSRITADVNSKLELCGIANYYSDFEPDRRPKKYYTVSQLVAGAIEENNARRQRLMVTVIQAVGVPLGEGEWDRSDCYVKCEIQGTSLVTPSVRGTKPLCKWSSKLEFSVVRKKLPSSTLVVRLMRGSATGKHTEVGSAEIFSGALITFLSKPEGSTAEENLQILRGDGGSVKGCHVSVVLTTLDDPPDGDDDDLLAGMSAADRLREQARRAALAAAAAKALKGGDGQQEGVEAVGCCGCSCAPSKMCVIS